MKSLIVLAIACVAAQAFDLDTEWEQFKVKYERNHLNSQEHGIRKNIFADNLKFIEKHNAEHAMGLHTFTVGINKFADLTNDEFVKMYTGFKQSTDHVAAASGVNASVQDFPDYLDWRIYNKVTPVKDQGQCGSCWAFSTTGTIEGAYARRTGKLVSVSEQDLVDCVAVNNGCGGGFPYKALVDVINKGGIDTEVSYPYEAYQGQCRFDANNIGAKIYDARQVLRGDEEDLLKAVAMYGPVSIAIDASHYSFQLYQSGIYSDPACNPNYMEHAVLAVGYGSEDGNDYWIVKNSWGTGWGDEGYIKMARNQNNMCGVATMACFALA